MDWEKLIAECDAKIDGVLAAAKAEGFLSDDRKAELDKLEAERADLDRKKASAADLAALERRQAERNVVPRKTTASTPGKPTISNIREAAEDDPAKGFKSHRDFLMSVMSAGRGNRLDDRLKPLRAATAGSDEHGEYSDGYGGFMVPVSFMPNLMKIQAEGDPTAALTRKVTMQSPTVRLPARVDKNHSTSVSGGLQVYRRAETQTVSSSRVQIEMIELQANELFGVSFATEELLQDSPLSYVELIDSGFREEIPARIINEKLYGTGVGQYMGILNSPCLITASKDGGQTADTITGTNLVAMRKRCWGYGNAVWLVNHDTLDQLYTCKLGATGDARYLFKFEEGDDLVPRLMGRPVIFTEYCSTLGDVGDIILANWSQYLEGTLQSLQSQESVHVRFLEHERTFKFYMRNAGAPWWRTALTPKKSATTLSPFVVLEAR